jgi:hypothetical protein
MLMDRLCDRLWGRQTRGLHRQPCGDLHKGSCTERKAILVAPPPKARRRSAQWSPQICQARASAPALEGVPEDTHRQEDVMRAPVFLNW